MAGKVAIITAGGRGMGAATARHLHRDGYKLALMAPSDSAENLAAELGGVAVRGRTDNAGDLEALVGKAMDTFGRVDAVVTHTGGPPKGDLLEISDDAWHQGLDLVVLLVHRMARLVTPIMQTQGGGAIVNITTFSAYEPDLRFPVSSPLRAAVGSYAKLYDDRYGSDGIRMNNVLPGFTDSLDLKPELVADAAIKRIGTVDEIAATAVFLLSDGAGYITGQNIRVDGGLTRHV
jgi:NAD(P)-dependent dehydrogenase (short-subunit alcohol dehydrogenase family)